MTLILFESPPNLNLFMVCRFKSWVFFWSYYWLSRPPKMTLLGASFFPCGREEGPNLRMCARENQWIITNSTGVWQFWSHHNPLVVCVAAGFVEEQAPGMAAAGRQRSHLDESGSVPNRVHPAQPQAWHRVHASHRPALGAKVQDQSQCHSRQRTSKLQPILKFMWLAVHLVPLMHTGMWRSIGTLPQSHKWDRKADMDNISNPFPVWVTFFADKKTSQVLAVETDH